MFDEAKTAQIAAFFLKKCGNRVEYLKIIKLIYLAEREHLNRYHIPMTGDRLSSLDCGPVVSITYNCIKKEAGVYGKIWHQWVTDRDGYTIALKHDFNDADLDELSEADIEVLTNVWNQYGWMSWKQLIKYTHNHLPEWTDPHGTSIPIKYADLLTLLGYEPDQVAEIVESIKENCTPLRAAAYL